MSEISDAEIATIGDDGAIIVNDNPQVASV